MPNRPGPSRIQLRPGVDFNHRTIPCTREARRTWFTLHKVDAPAVAFTKLGHHRFSHPDCPFPVLYLGATVQTCLWEVFGDDVFRERRIISLAKWNGCVLSRITLPELNVCAVGLQRTRDAMSVDKASLFAADLSIPQEWGLALQQHPADFEAIRYASRFVDQPCLAVFDRGDIKSRIHAKLLGSLSGLDSAVDWLEERRAALL